MGIKLIRRDEIELKKKLLSNIIKLVKKRDLVINVLEEINKFKKYTNRHIIKPINISQENLICPISLEPIDKNKIYKKCDICKYNFSEDSINKYFNYNIKNKKCPLCRQKWTSNYNTYLNQIDKYLEWSIGHVFNDIFYKSFIKYNKINFLNITRKNKKWFYASKKKLTS
jgi:Zn finger protein HypA/HybF involved in hydrogenase expression